MKSKACFPLVLALLLGYPATIHAQEIGACCLAAGDCEQLTFVECLIAPGSYAWMAGAPCDPNPCFSPWAACCLPGGECEEVLGPAECAALGGEYFSGWVRCSDDPCEVSPGACCLPGGCVVLMEEDCLDVPEAIMWVPGVSCDPDPCLPTPTEQESWGQIKGEYR